MATESLLRLCFISNHSLRSTVHHIHLSQKNETPLHFILLLSLSTMRTLSFLEFRSNFAVLYALIFWKLERLAFTMTVGIKILRRFPEDIPSGDNILNRHFKFLRIRSEDTLPETEIFNRSAFLSPHPGRTFYPHHPSPPGSPSIPTQVEEIIRTALAQETPPSSPIPSSDSRRHTYSIHRDFPEPSSICARQFCHRQDNGRGDNRNTRVINRPWR